MYGQPQHNIVLILKTAAQYACCAEQCIHAVCTLLIQIAQTVLLIESTNQRSSCHSIMAFCPRPLTVVPNRFLFFLWQVDLWGSLSPGGLHTPDTELFYLAGNTRSRCVLPIVVSSVVLSSDHWFLKILKRSLECPRMIKINNGLP